MNYDVEHTHSIQIPEAVFEVLKEQLPDRYQVQEKTIQFRYDENHYIRFWY